MDFCHFYHIRGFGPLYNCTSIGLFDMVRNTMWTIWTIVGTQLSTNNLINKHKELNSS